MSSRGITKQRTLFGGYPARYVPGAYSTCESDHELHRHGAARRLLHGLDMHVRPVGPELLEDRSETRSRTKQTYSSSANDSTTTTTTTTQAHMPQHLGPVNILWAENVFKNKRH